MATGPGARGEASPSGMNPIDRLARRCVTTAARRWPADLSDRLSREWCAELDALREDPTSGPLGRARLAIGFAASLLVRPGVEAAGAAERTWHERACDLGSALLAGAGLAAIPLLAAGLSNVVHDGYHVLRPGLSEVSRSLASAALLGVAMGLMSMVGIVAARTWRAGRPWAAGLTGTA